MGGIWREWRDRKEVRTRIRNALFIFKYSYSMRINNCAYHLQVRKALHNV